MHDRHGRERRQATEVDATAERRRGLTSGDARESTGCHEQGEEIERPPSNMGLPPEDAQRVVSTKGPGAARATGTRPGADPRASSTRQ